VASRSWRRVSVSERARVLRRLSALIERYAESLGRLESQQTGKPLRQGLRDAEITVRYIDALPCSRMGAHTDGLLQAPGRHASTQPAESGAWVGRAATMPRAVTGGLSSWPTIRGAWRPGLPPRLRCSPAPS
jgi:acyl-CoA reductase-like NAD-dependent aldehyde dehydrogenase